MYADEFDGAAAFSGGGFMPPQPMQTADPIPSAFTKNRDTHMLIPLTVNQINKVLLSNDDKVNFLIDGVDVNNVKLLGMVLNKAEKITDVSFVLDDGTGRIECNRWVQDSVDTKEMESIIEGMYVRVHGQLKGFQGKKQLVVFGIKPVTDFDEITHHFVECIYVHSYNTKLMFTGHCGAADGLKGIDKMVLDYLMLPASAARENGIHQEELARQLGIPLDKIQVALNCLVEEGLVYNSVDDYHFKSAADG